MRIEGGGGIGVAKAMSLGRKVFAKVDENRDGVITARELRASAVVHKMGLAGPGESEKQWMARVDANKDGVLSRKEAEAAFTAAAHAKPEAAIAATLLTQGMAEFPYAQPEAKESEVVESAPAEKAASAAPVRDEPQKASRTYAAIDRLAQEEAQTKLSIST